MPKTAAEYIDLVSDPAEDDVPGWLHPTDAMLLNAINDAQHKHGIGGDVLEIGVYKGKSAILLGWFPRDGERLVVCDVFEGAAGVDAENSAENAAYYDGLDRAEFESNYLRFHRELPVIHPFPSEHLGEYVAAGSCRLVHIDGSHAFDVVREDIALAKRSLGPGGIVAIDDWSSAHVPGVAMAFWQEFDKGDLVPLAFTSGKFYATWDPHGVTADELATWAEDEDRVEATYPHRLGAHEARHFTMTREFWQRYSARFYASGQVSGVAAF